MIHYALIIANHRPECNVFLWLFYLVINFNNVIVFLFFRPSPACLKQQKGLLHLISCATAPNQLKQYALIPAARTDLCLHRRLGRRNRPVNPRTSRRLPDRNPDLPWPHHRSSRKHCKPIPSSLSPPSRAATRARQLPVRGIASRMPLLIIFVTGAHFPACTTGFFSRRAAHFSRMAVRNTSGMQVLPSTPVPISTPGRFVPWKSVPPVGSRWYFSIM